MLLAETRAGQLGQHVPDLILHLTKRLAVSDRPGAGVGQYVLDALDQSSRRGRRAWSMSTALFRVTVISHAERPGRDAGRALELAQVGDDRHPDLLEAILSLGGRQVPAGEPPAARSRAHGRHRIGPRPRPRSAEGHAPGNGTPGKPGPGRGAPARSCDLVRMSSALEVPCHHRHSLGQGQRRPLSRPVRRFCARRPRRGATIAPCEKHASRRGPDYRNTPLWAWSKQLDHRLPCGTGVSPAIPGGLGGRLPYNRPGSFLTVLLIAGDGSAGLWMPASPPAPGGQKAGLAWLPGEFPDPEMVVVPRGRGEPSAIRRESDTDQRAPRCRRGCSSCRPVDTDQSRTIPSLPAVARIVPSGEKATASVPLAFAASIDLFNLAGREIPESNDSFASTRRGQQAAVFREGNGIARTTLILQPKPSPARVEIPEDDRRIRAGSSRGQSAAVG